jgi:hypothetical protein
MNQKMQLELQVTGEGMPAGGPCRAEVNESGLENVSFNPSVVIIIVVNVVLSCCN